MKSRSFPDIGSVLPHRLIILLIIYSILRPLHSGWLGVSLGHAQNASLAITRIIPSGEDVENQNQIVIQFDQPVVPLGRMERDSNELSITITPEIKGQWRWLNPTDLALNIDADSPIKPATKYVITIKPGIKTQDGVTLAAPVVHTFITRRPSVSYYEFRNWRSPGMPVIALHFNQPVSKDSVAQKVFFSLPGDLLYKNPVQVENQQYLPPRTNRVSSSSSTEEKSEDGAASISDQDDNKDPENKNSTITIAKYKKTSRRWVVYPTNELPPDSTIALMVNPGIASGSGTEKSVETKEIVKFDTFPDFEFAGIRCYTIKGTDQIVISPEESSSGDLMHIVNPRGYTELLFTVPVNFEQIRDHVQFIPDLAQGRKDYDPWANGYNSYGLLNFPHTKGELYGVAIPQYLKAWQQYTILEKSTGISDLFGRQLLAPIDFTFYTDHRKPGYQILHETGVLEKDVDSEVPIALTNIDKMTISYNTLTNQESGGKTDKDLQDSGADLNNASTDGTKKNWDTAKNSPDSVQNSVDYSSTCEKTGLRVQDIAYFLPLGVREMLNNRSGAVYGKVTDTSPKVDQSERDSHFFTVVTPWQIHAKMGHFNSLVWVTSLVTGEPVQGVTVTVHRDLLENLTRNSQILAQGVTDRSGIAMLPGMVELDPARESFKNSWEYGLPRLIIKAAKNDDMALLPLTYSHDFSVPVWRVSDGNVSSRIEPKYAHIHAWGTTPQGIYKAGDTIDYKIYVRDQNNSAFSPPPSSGYKLIITDPSGKDVFEKKNITLSEFSAFDGQYTVPENGVIGWYRFYLSAPFSESGWEPLKVLVTDFTPSPFRVSTELNGDNFKPGDTLNIETAATLHAGGPYADARVRVTVRLREELFHTDDPVTKDFIFYKAAGGGDWRPGVSGEKQKSPATGTDSGAGESSSDDATPAVQQSPDSDKEAVPESLLEEEQISDQSSEEMEIQENDNVEYPSDVPELLLEKSSSLDSKGVIKNSLDLAPSTIGYGKIEVESAVQDDRGKFVSNMKSARYLGKNLFVGVKSPQWIYESGKPSIMQAVVVNGNGKSVAGIKIDLGVQRRVTKASKVKGAGNAYLTQYINEWVVTEEKSLVSETEPVEFEFNPSQPGDYRIIARIDSTAAQQTAEALSSSHTASILTWVTGRGEVLWQAPDDYSLSIIPEQNSYKAGETAKYLVKNPFPGAYALISVERYGILRQWVERLEDSTQVIEVPVEKDDVPGFFLSVTVISPRVAKPLTNDDVDLGKPTFRMGYVETGVTESGHDINIRAVPEKSVYKPGERVRVAISATREQKADQNNKEKIELAIAVLDEAVFDLISSGRDHFDIFKGFHTLDGLDLENYTLLANIIGRRKFEKKGANVGGDGGAGMKMRSFFKYVSYWNPSLVTDDNGNANIEFTAPDNLTGWKVFVMAVTPSDGMGLGESNFKVNRPTEIRPVMPNQVTAEDSFEAGFSVMNRTDKPRKLKISVKMEHPDAVNNEDQFITKEIDLLPFKRKTIFFPVNAKEPGILIFTAEAKDELDGDSMRHTLKVNKKRSLVTVLNYGMISRKNVEHNQGVMNKAEDLAFSSGDSVDPGFDAGRAVEHLLYPSNIYTDTGTTQVTLYPTVLGNMEEGFAYMAQYPYACWEQKLSKAVMASHFMELKEYLPETFSWIEAKELPDKTLKQAGQFQAPNGGMAYFTPNNNYVCPYLSAYTALAFGWLKSRGFSVPENVEQKLMEYLATLLRNDISSGFDSNSFYSTGMASTVRAVALAALSQEGRLTVDDIKRYESHVKDMSLFGKAHFFMAALKVRGAQTIAEKVWDIILSSSHHSAGKLVFNETLDNGFYRILESPLRTQGALLSAIVKYGRHGNTDTGIRKENSKDKIAGASSGKKSLNNKKTVGKDRSKEAMALAFKLVRTITETRGRDNLCENTQENIFCMNGLADYSAAYEGDASRAGKSQKNEKGKSTLTGKANTLDAEARSVDVKAKIADMTEAKAVLNHEVLGEEVLGRAVFSCLKDPAVILTKQISPSDPGKKADIVITSNRAGTLYYSAGMSYSPKDDFDKPVNSGMEIRREYSVEKNGKWELLENIDLQGDNQGTKPVHPGDLIRVDLFLSLPAARNFPVVSDPVPGGFEPVNRDLATASIIDAEKSDSLLPEGSWWFKFKDWHEFNDSRWSFYHQELGHTSVRYYADYLPAGNYHLSYTAQAIAKGNFTAMPTHAEEMYNADIYGKSTSAKITVLE